MKYADVQKALIRVLFCSAFFSIVACSPFTKEARPGPDKQGEGIIMGAALGAGSGAVTGAQVSSGTGPGALVGAGAGAVLGMLSGLGIDLVEEDQVRRQEEEQQLREIAWAQEVLNEHYLRRLELHPNRDIFPADLFFDKDSVELRSDAKLLTRELARLTRRRMPWSRIVIASYSTSTDQDSPYSAFLNKRRAEQLALHFVRAGIEPRRLLTQAVILSEPLVIDPYDSSGRYRQAIEIIPLDY